MTTDGDEGYDFNDICVGNGLLNRTLGEHIWVVKIVFQAFCISYPGVGSHPASCQVDW